MGKQLLRVLFTLCAFGGTLLCVSAASSQRAYFDDKCQCKCAFCPAGQRLCPTTNECIDEFKWCNGVQDCPDDEQGCEPRDEERPPAMSPCPEPTKPFCPDGKEAKLMKDLRCPEYKCECDPKMCPPLQWPVDLDPGLEAFVDQKGCCNRVSVRCNVNKCPGIPTCPTGTELEQAPGECCTLYKCVDKNKCAYIHKYKVVNGVEVLLNYAQRYQRLYPVDSSWTDGLCTNCTCSRNGNQYQYSCNVQVCLGQQKDSEDYEYAVLPSNYDVCCPEQRRTACRGNGQTYYIGSEWRQPEDGKCRWYRCEESPTTREAVKVVLTQICNKTCRPVGEGWESTLRPCFQVECVRNDAGVVKTKYTLKECPKLPSNCPKNNIVRDETGCCQKCQVTPGSCAPHILEPSRTLLYFVLYDPEHGLCYNAEPIANLAECRGQCFSKTVFNPETNNFTTSGRCCTVKKAVSSKVLLSCENGHRIQKDYQSPIECSCTKCGEERTAAPVMEAPEAV